MQQIKIMMVIMTRIKQSCLPYCSSAIAALEILNNIKSCLTGKIYSHGFPTRELQKNYHYYSRTFFM